MEKTIGKIGDKVGAKDSISLLLLIRPAGRIFVFARTRQVVF
uniref:Uncharacterized protein n=1 Tax=Elizabethkingia anophelis TaxID=1117645 RepID=A0A455ZF44_9FLAO|nr:TPA_exp: hypothetical protein [Elizabethkingia anophelis]